MLRRMAASQNASNELSRVRERLGELVGAEQAAPIFFEALEGVEELPNGGQALADFVRGPLQRCLERRLGQEQADRITQGLERAVVDTPRSGAHKRAPDFDAATTVGTQTGPARLVVVARGTRLAERLRLAVGGDDVAVAPAADPQRAGELAHEINASMIIVDGTDVPAGRADAFVDGLGGVPDHVMLVMWTTDSPEAEQLQEELAFCGLRVTMIDRREGVEPLIDLMRAHRRKT